MLLEKEGFAWLGFGKLSLPLALCQQVIVRFVALLIVDTLRFIESVLSCEIKWWPDMPYHHSCCSRYVCHPVQQVMLLHATTAHVVPLQSRSVVGYK